MSTETQRIDAMRHFGRFYTEFLGLLEERLHETPFSLPEGRVLFEVAKRDGPTATATAIGERFGLDAGYVSRLLRRLQRRGLVAKRPSPEDGRVKLLSLTAAGRKAYTSLDDSASDQIRAVLRRLGDKDQAELLRSMAAIERTLLGSRERSLPYLLRPHQSGDLGWILSRHAVLYRQEYGFDERFEKRVAKIVVDILPKLDPERERGWIAERDGEPVGSIFLMARSARVAQLRLLLVEPHARGLGIGERLVQECTRFARERGYRKIVLHTTNVLIAARKLYAREGYERVGSTPHDGFGPPVEIEDWALEL